MKRYILSRPAERDLEGIRAYLAKEAGAQVALKVIGARYLQSRNAPDRDCSRLTWSSGHPDFALKGAELVDTVELLIDKLSKTRSNGEFLAAMSG